ncbi:MAG TPA: CoA-binding protein [Acetobacteraceae bacterium]|nr:CoA-binding protein [Acetobacteraceae bacterium]
MSNAEIESILTGTRRIAMVGASPRPERPAYHVLEFLLDEGYDVTPVNPAIAGQTLLGRTVVATLDEAAPLDMVEIFRAPSQVGPVVADAIRLGARTIWMQLGVINEDAAEAARAAGLNVVMDRCPAVELPRLRPGR